MAIQLEGEIAELAKQRDSARAQLREVQDSTVMRMDPKAVRGRIPGGIP